jgi:hypothetical protein
MEKVQYKPSTGAHRRKQARLTSDCIVCGSRNRNGLHLRFDHGYDGASASWVPTGQWESFQGTIHGGIIGAVLDEAMSKALIAREWEAFTAELRVRFRSRVVPGEALEVRGWVVARKKRHIQAEAALVTAAGDERAHAWGTFLQPGEGHIS